MCVALSLCVLLGISFYSGMSKVGEAFSTRVLPCGVPAGGCFPFSKPLSLVEGKCSEQDVPGCCIGVNVNVWLVSAGNCKIFPVEGAGSLALRVYIDCYIFKWREDLGGT